MKKITPKSYGRLSLGVALLAFFGLDISKTQPPFNRQGEMAGEVTTNGVVLQSRITAKSMADGDLAGVRGVARFEISTDPSFTASRKTGWLDALPERDYIVRAPIADLDPDTIYYYRVEFGPDRELASSGPRRVFRTLPGAQLSRPYRLAVVT